VRQALVEPSVLVLVTSTQRRGAEVFGEALARGLGDAGLRTAFVALNDPRPSARVEAESLFEPGEPVDLSGMNRRVASKLRQYLKENRPTVVFAGGGATLKYSVAAVTGMRSAPKLVYSSIGEPAYWARGAAGKSTLRLLLRKPDLVTAVSHATATQLQDFGVPQARIRVAHPGVPESYLEIADGIPEARLKLLLLGSLSGEKDPVAAVEAVLAMEAEAVLRVVGAGPLEGQVRAVAGSDERVEVVGPVTDVIPQLAWSDVLLLTSRTEGLPGVVLEAAAAGVPAVAYGVGGVAEAIDDGVTGIVAEPGDLAAITAGLDRLAGDRNALRSMSAAARVKVREHFTLGAAIRRYEAVIREVLADE
jgi:glycosyltransferase involved in cell wall biosynthesis